MGYLNSRNGIGIVFVFICILHLQVYVNCENQYNLTKIIVISRHGARYPLFPYPTSYFSTTLCNQTAGMEGELNQAGMKLMYQSGKSLKHRYIDGNPFRFLKEKYNHKEIMARSSIVARAMESTYCQLAGVYPPKGQQVWNPDVLWQPIPVYTKSLLDDPAVNLIEPFSPSNVCYVVSQEEDRLYQTEKYQTINKENQEFFRYLDKKAGYTENHVNLSNIWELIDDIQMQDYTYVAPAWIAEKWKDGQTVWNKLLYFFDIFLHIRHINKYSKLALGGTILQRVIENIEDDNNELLKAYFYGSHSEKLAPMSDCLGVYDKIFPIPPAATVVFEVYQGAKNDTKTIKIAYKSPDCPDFVYLNMTGCGETCSLGIFKNFSAPCIPDDVMKLCLINTSQTTQSSSKAYHSTPNHSAIIIATVGLFVCLIGVVLLCLAARYRKTPQQYDSLS